MIELVVASGNQHKISEITGLLMGLPVKVSSLSDYPDSPKVVEDGKTFEDNARKKAREIFKYLKKPVLADDSGLEVVVLGNQPGVFSARFAGEQATDQQNNDLLLKRMNGMQADQRAASFVCSICFIDDNHEFLFNGIVNGVILENPRGRNGFGYDPLFFYPPYKKTFAELSLEEKSKVSHRGMAMESFKTFLTNHLKSIDKKLTF